MTIIAEVGANHLGDMELAKNLIFLAAENGADAAKFQLYSTEGLKRTAETLKILKQSELNRKQSQELFDCGTQIGIEVFFTPFNSERVKWCEEMGVKRYKIAARSLDNDTLDAIKETKKPVLASISPTYPRPERWADEFFDVDFLYCVSKYPSPLTSMRFGNLDFNFTYQGFSDHTIGLDAAKIALARGAQIIEKHFCLDHKTGIDATWSMDSSELKELKRWEGICKQVI